MYLNYCYFLLNVAVTVVLAVRFTTHVPVPEHPPPDQPVKTEPVRGAAVSVTLVPPAKFAPQEEPQLIPEGELVTVPLPAPTFNTTRLYVVLTVPQATFE